MKKNGSIKIYCGNSFTIYVYQIIILYTLNVFNVIYPYLNKIEMSFLCMKKTNMQNIKVEQWIKIVMLIKRKLLADLDSLCRMKMTKHNCTTHTHTHTHKSPTKYPVQGFLSDFPCQSFESFILILIKCDVVIFDLQLVQYWKEHYILGVF